MKDMNTMKHLAKRIVKLYMNKALIDKTEAYEELFHVCHQSEGARGNKNLNEDGKFIARFNKWLVDLDNRKPSHLLEMMDDFFEREDYRWEDHI
jgi:hypothetical protein